MTFSEREISDVSQRAVALFNDGFNCAEAVATAAADALAPGQTTFPTVATIFGGGCGRRGETCGALVGALMAVSIVHGRRPGEGPGAKKRCYDLAEMVVEDFREKYGVVTCVELTGVNLATAEGQKAFEVLGIHKNRCAGIVTEAVRLALVHGAP